MTAVSPPPHRRGRGRAQRVVTEADQAIRVRKTPRQTSSVSALARRVREVGLAVQAGDEPAIRAELKLLSIEAGLLAASDPLPLGRGVGRLRIAAEKGSTGRALAVDP